MAKAFTKFKLNSKGIRAMLRSSAVETDMLARAQRIARVAGEGFEADSFVGRNRARGDVFTETREAMQAEADNMALTRAIDAGRG